MKLAIMELQKKDKLHIEALFNEIKTMASENKILQLKKAFTNKLYQTKVRILVTEELPSLTFKLKIEKTTWEFTIELVDLILEIYILQENADEEVYMMPGKFKKKKFKDILNKVKQYPNILNTIFVLRNKQTNIINECLTDTHFHQEKLLKKAMKKKKEKQL